MTAAGSGAKRPRAIRVVFVVAALALVLSACGAPAAPTIDAAQVQASAAAAAATMIAATQAAMPTSTPLPPTPPPSPTPLPSPTLQSLSTLIAAASATSSSAEDCNHPLDVGASGAQATLLINNDTKGPITFSMGLGSKNSFGQCGYLGWSIAKGNSVSVSVPQTRTNQGDPCYWTYAWINDPKHTTTVSGGGICLNNPDKWTFDVGYDKIKVTPP